MAGDHQQFMQRAIALARASMRAGKGGPFGAVIVREGKILGEGSNHVIALHDPTAHGEIMAIRDACQKQQHHSLEGATIYTTGQPCPMCLAAIYWARLERIYYGFRIEDAAALGFDDTHFFREICRPQTDRLIPSSEISRELALSLAEEYRMMPDSPRY